jgi:V/A-type H+-transporting ATPase subunit E
MDVQLKELIEKIKTDGVKNAEDKAAEIIREAEIKSAEIFSGILRTGTAEVLSGKALTEGITSIIKNWKGDLDDMSVLISEKQLKEIEKELTGKLASEIKSGLQVKPYKTATSGFRVSEKDGKSFFDFTDEVLADYLSRYLNTSLTEILKG